MENVNYMNNFKGQQNQDKSSSSGVSLEHKMEKFMDVMPVRMNQQDETTKRFE